MFWLIDFISSEQDNSVENFTYLQTIPLNVYGWELNAL